jgi:hypothetical protein
VEFIVFGGSDRGQRLRSDHEETHGREPFSRFSLPQNLPLFLLERPETIWLECHARLHNIMVSPQVLDFNSINEHLYNFAGLF